MVIRPSTRAQDAEAVWGIMEPVLRAGETYTLPVDLPREAALDYWFAPAHECFAALDEAQHLAGIYFLQANQGGGGDHVANCGYMTDAAAQGRGVARRMLEHSLRRAAERGFRAMQFNFVVSTNERAAKTWLSYGFEVVGRLPAAFRHPRLGYVDAWVMFRTL